MIDKIKTMTLEEKVAQLQGVWLKDLIENDEVSFEKCRAKIPHGIGHVCQFGSGNAYRGQKLAELVYQVQQFVLQETRCKIPVLFHEEVIDGVAAKGATVTPQMLGMACSFNPALVKRNAQNAAQTLKTLGGYYALSPMMDIITDARWARGEEGFGEDSYMVSAFADAFIEGLQSEGVGATAKHYAGYGVENQEEDFFINETLAPFEVAVVKSGVRGIMPGYHKFRGVPSSCSEELLLDSLRRHLGYEGVVVSDYGAITNITRDFHYVDSKKEAAVRCIKAGMDADFPIGENYQYLTEAVQEGMLEESCVDAALARVLQMKEALIPAEITLAQNVDVDPVHHRQAALESAREAIVLLKNDGILPLSDAGMRVLLTGPNADSYYSVLGDYSWGGLAEFFHGIPGDKTEPRLCTLLDGLRAVSGDGIVVQYARGFDWVETPTDDAKKAGGDDRAQSANYKPLESQPETDFGVALEAAAQSDVIVAAVGENRYLCGESTTRDDINLPGAQEAYVERLLATGKPVILCVFGGRPMAISRLASKCAAVLYAWYPGEEGGTACAEILFGKTNPTAKLAVTIPDSNQEVPVTLKDTGRQMMFPFGYGLSYTSFAYRDFVAPAQVDTSKEYFEVSYTVENTGARAGAEITQFYFENKRTNDKKLLGFTKTPLAAEECKRVTMRFYLDQFGVYTKGAFEVSAALYQMTVGSTSVQTEFAQEIAIVGSAVKKEKRTAFFSQCV